MSAADKIAEARALIEPLTGYSPGPWEVVTDLPAIAIAAGNHRVVQTPNQNNYRHFGRSEPWLGIGTFSNAALIAAAPALRDTVAALADLADAQAQENAELRRMLGSTVCYGCNRRIGDKQWLGFICVSCKSKREFLSRAALGDAS